MNIRRQDFCRFCHLLYERGFVRGSGGNLSLKRGKRIWITPTGISLRDISPADIVIMDLDGKVIKGGTPTTEKDFHLGILREREEISIVCHVHCSKIISATMLLNPSDNCFPPLTPGFVINLFPLKMIPFMVPGSREFATQVINSFKGENRRAILIQNHGMVCVGSNFKEILNILDEIEEASEILLFSGKEVKEISKRYISQMEIYGRSKSLKI